MKNWDNGENWEQNEAKKGFLEKVMNLFGIETEEVIEEVYSEDSYTGESYVDNNGKSVNSKSKERGKVVRDKVVSLPNPSKSVRLVVFEPQSFEDVQTIVNHLKNRRPVILNMEELEKSLARRLTDFVGGAVYALDGTVQKVSTSIMLFTPANVEVSIPPRTELKDDFFSTNKLNR